MQRFAIFVDGSNLSGSLKTMNLHIDDYEPLYGHVFQESLSLWRATCHVRGDPETQLRRTYWYVVGSIDDWDLSLPQAQQALRRAYDDDPDTKSFWLEKAAKANPALKGQALQDKAWSECFASFKEWYEKKKESLDGMRKFYQGVRMRTDIIDLIEAGHWKVNFIRHHLDEKGLDTALAVDMVALQDNYDIAVVISGDADSIPSVKHLKEKDKIIAAVEFVNGSPPEPKGRTFSSRLKEHADFVVRIYETELLKLKIAHRPSPKT